MRVIDEDGDLFGLVNAVDALALLVVVVVVVGGGVAVLSGAGAEGDDPGILTQTVTLQANGSANLTGLRTGPVEDPRIASVTDVDASGTGPGSVTVRLVVNTSEDGLTTFGGERVYIGRPLTLRLGDRTVSGVITDAFEPARVQTAPTPTPTTTSTPTTPTATATQTQTSTPTPASTRTITVAAAVEEGTADALEEGPVPAAGVVRIVEVTRQSTDGSTVELDIRLEIAVTEADGTVYFRGVELAEGSRLRLDLDPPVSATVTDA